MTQFPIRIDGATPINNGADAFLPPVGVSSVPLTEAQRLDTMAYLRRRIADAGRRADRALTDAHYEDAQRDVTKFARQLAEIAARPVGRVPSVEV
jgi:citrate lyase beta subunit